MKILSLFKKQRSDDSTYAIKTYKNEVDRINALEPQLNELSDSQLKHRAKKLKENIQDDLKKINLFPVQYNFNETIEEKELRREKEDELLKKYLPEGFALVREASKRVNGERHFDVQLIGGVVLCEGKIAEMKTGEGKTLVATLALYLNSLLGRGAHLVTVNDYLAKLGAGWMGRIFYFLGQTTSYIGHDVSYLFDPDSEMENADTRVRNFKAITRKEAYEADITYGTNNEFGFDYLRDNMAPNFKAQSQRPFQFAIVDEVDSILIDEARTPLIISAPAEESANLYLQFSQVAKQLKPKTDFVIDEKLRTVNMTDEGIDKVERLTGISNLYGPNNVVMVHHLEEAVKAQALFKKDKEYVVRDDEIIIIDEFTGRMMPGRRYSGGLHQAIEAKENVTVKRESDTLATVSFQNLFRLYPKLSGMTGTAATEAEEFYKIYKLDVVTIPTNRPMVRIDHNDQIYKTEEGKFNAVIEEVKSSIQKDQPVLIGTISIHKSEYLSKLLKKAGIRHQVLNAKQHEKEARVITQAGQPGTVTVATNMAGRGVDIILGGYPPSDKKALKNWQALHNQVLSAGGLKVIGTERHEARRIDNQLRGRSGRQGDPGESIFFVSMEDDLMRIFGGDRLKNVMNSLGLPDNQPISHKIITRSIETAQKRVEGYNFDTRKHLVDYDDVANKQREVLYRKRRKILSLDNSKDSWLHQEILEMLSSEEKEQYISKVKDLSSELLYDLEKAVFLRSIDLLWIEHLNAMEQLRQGIGLRGYGQREPLVEYKQEAYGLFQRLLAGIDNQVIEILLKLEINPAILKPKEDNSNRKIQMTGADDSLAGGSISSASEFKGKFEEKNEKFSKTESHKGVTVTVRKKSQTDTDSSRSSANKGFGKVGRNDPCPCGATKPDGTLKKYKHCHGK